MVCWVGARCARHGRCADEVRFLHPQNKENRNRSTWLYFFFHNCLEEEIIYCGFTGMSIVYNTKNTALFD